MHVHDEYMCTVTSTGVSLRMAYIYTFTQVHVPYIHVHDEYMCTINYYHTHTYYLPLLWCQRGPGYPRLHPQGLQGSRPTGVSLWDCCTLCVPANTLKEQKRPIKGQKRDTLWHCCTLCVPANTFWTVSPIFNLPYKVTIYREDFENDVRPIKQKRPSKEQKRLTFTVQSHCIGRRLWRMISSHCWEWYKVPIERSRTFFFWECVRHLSCPRPRIPCSSRTSWWSCRAAWCSRHKDGSRPQADPPAAWEEKRRAFSNVCALVHVLHTHT